MLYCFPLFLLCTYLQVLVTFIECSDIRYILQNIYLAYKFFVYTLVFLSQAMYVYLCN